MRSQSHETDSLAVADPPVDCRLTPDVAHRLIRRISVAGRPEFGLPLAPFTQAPIYPIPLSNAAAVDSAFSVARRAQRRWSQTPIEHRSRIMMRFHDLVLSRRDEILDIVQLETGKARLHALEELLDVAVTARHYARTAAPLLRPTRHAGAFPLITEAIELHHPKGIVGVISPWNYPLTLAVSDAIPALMAGNGIVLKPDLQTTLTALWAVDLLYEAGIPEGLFGVVAGEGSDVGPMLTERGDYIMFTGSTRVGREVAARCGERLVSCSMELGGKNAMIVCDDASIARAAEIAERACFANAGQLCISMERIYVHNSVREQFISAFVARTRNLRLAASIGWGGDVGSLASSKQLETVASHVDDAVARGAVVLAGGKPRPDIGPLCYEPTILTEVNDSMVCFENETFGPVVSIYGFDVEDDAIAQANDSDYGLNAAVITRDARRGRRIAARLHAGTVNVNEGYATAWSAMGSPMGGVGQSGLGRRHGREGLLKYTESQTVATQRLIGWGAPPMMTNEQWGSALVAMIRVLKAVGRK